MKIRPLGTEFFFYADGRTEGHDGANSRFSQFFERAQKFEPVHLHTMKACREKRGVASLILNLDIKLT